MKNNTKLAVHKPIFRPRGIRAELLVFKVIGESDGIFIKFIYPQVLIKAMRKLQLIKRKSDTVIVLDFLIV